MNQEGETAKEFSIDYEKSSLFKYSNSTVNLTGNQSTTKNDNSLIKSKEKDNQELTISRSMSNLFKVSKIKVTNDEENHSDNEEIHFSDDSDDSIIMSGLKDDKSFNRININTTNESMKINDSWYNIANKSLKSNTDRQSSYRSNEEGDLNKENINNLNANNKFFESEIDSTNKRQDVSDYSSKSKSNFFSREDSSILGISDDMITIEDTYKETEQITEKPKNGSFIPTNYLINHIEMNVIEEQADEEDRSCTSSFRRSNNLSAFNSNDPYYIQSNVSKEGRKTRESFETFGQKSLGGYIQTLKSDSKCSRQQDISIDIEKELYSIHNDLITNPSCEQTTEKEKKLNEFTDCKAKRNCSIDDSTDVSAQITKRTNNTKNSNRKEDTSSCQSLPAINLDNILKLRNDSKIIRNSFEENESIKADNKQNRIHIQEYNEYLGEQAISSNSHDGESLKSLIIENNKSSEVSESLRESYKRSIKQLKDELTNNGNELGISSILENGEINEETDILEYCTPNYATNTSKLFSSKEKDPQLGITSGSDKIRNSNDSRILIDIQNIESFSLGPSKIFKSKYFSQKESQKLVEELRSIEKRKSIINFKLFKRDRKQS